mgnify:CR=1 FL=1
MYGKGNGKEEDNGGGRGLKALLSQRAVEYAIAQTLTVVSKSPEETGSRLAWVFRRGVGEGEDRRLVADWFQRYLSPGRPGNVWAKHLLTSVHPNVRRHYVARFIANIVLRPEQRVHRLPDGREIPVPATLVISPTMRCNLRCVGCYAGDYAKTDDLTPEEVIRVLGEARELGTRFFVVSGGEPLIYAPLFDIVRRFDDCFFQFYTSGHLITEQTARRIVELGNVVPAISVEGFQAETDARRGPGGFERVMRAMDLLREARAMFAFSATATRQNLATITSDAFVQLMVQKGAHYGFYFSYIPIGRSPDVNLMPTPEERNRLREAVNRLRNKYPVLLADFWNDGALTDGCLSGGRNYLHINNRGDVEPCVFAHFAVDNIREKSLKECLASDFFRALRQAAPYGRNLLRPCPIIDHPEVLRGLVKKFGARPTHAGAETIITELAGHLDSYSKGLAEVYDPVWAREYRWAAKLHKKPQYDWGDASTHEPAEREMVAAKS